MRGADAFKKKLKRTMKFVEDDLSKKHRGLALKILTDLVVHTPQWSGNLAANWTIGSGKYGEISGYSKSDWFNQDPFVRGDDPAVASVLGSELNKLSRLTYKNPITITNKTAYASEVEAGKSTGGKPIRDENKLASYGGVAMIGYVSMKYSALKGAKALW